jgi:hypothetical protein
MFKTRLLIVSLIVSVVICFGAMDSRALPLSIGEAFIDSVSFNFSGSGFLGRSSSVFSRVELTPIDGIADDQETDFGPGFAYLDTAASAANSNEQAIAATSSNSSIFAFGRTGGRGNAFAQAFQNLEFTALSEGTFTVDLGYRLDQLLETELSDERAWAKAEAGLRLFKLGTGINDVDEVELFNALTSPGNIDQSESGRLYVALDFAAGEKGRFDYATTVQSGVSPVSEPFTFFLLGSGLIALVGVSRKSFE